MEKDDTFGSDGTTSIQYAGKVTVSFSLHPSFMITMQSTKLAKYVPFLLNSQGGWI